MGCSYEFDCEFNRDIWNFITCVSMTSAILKYFCPLITPKNDYHLFLYQTYFFECVKERTQGDVSFMHLKTYVLLTVIQIVHK